MSAKVEAARHFKGLGLELAQCHIRHTLLVKHIIAPSQIQGKRIAQEDEYQETDSPGAANGTDYYTA